MDPIIDFFKSLLPEGFDAMAFIKGSLVLLLGVFLLALLARIFFGKKSTLNRSISSAISILFIYVITIVITSFGVDLEFILSPLPFVSISGDYLQILIYSKEQYQLICDQLLSMIILAFLANLADGWLPQGKNLFSWFFFRCLSVMIAMLLHLLANAVIQAFLPEGLLYWAPVILLGLLVILMLLGALKIIVGALLSTTHPFIGILYTFFFANAVGKQISKAVLTTAILAGMVCGLHYLGCSAIFIASSALAAYIPFLAVLLLVWYLVGHLL